ITDHFERAQQPSAEFEPGQLALIREIKRLADDRSLPIVVIYIPYRDEMLDPNYPGRIERARKFSELLEAQFFDGRDVFRGLPPGEIRELWFPYDGHWNHLGSSRFADYVVPRIPTWLASSRSLASGKASVDSSNFRARNSIPRMDS